MDVPPGGETQKRKVCHLKKSLYGLKQSPGAWFNRFTKVIKLKLIALYTKQSNGKLAILIVYVIDIIVPRSNYTEIETLKKYLNEEFELKDLGVPRYFLGMEVAMNKTGISISQKKYIPNLFHETKMLACKQFDTPVEPNHKLDLRKRCKC